MMKIAHIDLRQTSRGHVAYLIDDATNEVLAMETRTTADEALRALDAIIERLELEVMLVMVEREILKGAK